MKDNKSALINNNKEKEKFKDEVNERNQKRKRYNKIALKYWKKKIILKK